MSVIAVYIQDEREREREEKRERAVERDPEHKIKRGGTSALCIVPRGKKVQKEEKEEEEEEGLFQTTRRW